MPVTAKLDPEEENLKCVSVLFETRRVHLERLSEPVSQSRYKTEGGAP